MIIKTAIIGMGFIGKMHALAITNAKNVDLAAVVDIDEESGKAAAKEYGVKYYKDMEDLLTKEDIDLVDICVPTWLHESCISLAIKYKKHILCEKPITLSMESFDRIVDMVHKAGVRFMVAQVIRFWPEYAKITELYKKGAFGNVSMVYASRLAESQKTSTWHHFPEKSGGCLYDLSIHDLDYVQYLFGEVDSVYALGLKSETGCWDQVSSLIKFKNGVSATVEGTYGVFGGFPFTMSLRVHGAKIVADYVLRAGLNLEDVGSAKRELVLYTDGSSPERLKIELYDAYQKEIEYFADCIINNKPNDIVSMESTRATLRLVLAIKESLESGKRIIL